MNWTPPSKAEIQELLKRSKTVAIVGVSDKEDRASNAVAKYLLDNSHFTLYFVNPLLETVLGQKSYASLSEIDGEIDIVDIFRKPADCLPIAQEAIEIGAKAIWLQLGIINSDVAELGASAGLTVVMDRCIKIDYAAM